MSYVNEPFEKIILDIENYLSVGAILPVLGQITGALKVILGIIQTTGALLGLIFSTPFLCTRKGREIFWRSVSHFVNGLANIGGGILDATPLIGNLIGIYRAKGESRFKGLYNKPYLIVGYKVVAAQKGPEYRKYQDRAYIYV